MPSLPDGYVYAYAEGDDGIKTSLRLKEMKDELTAMVSSRPRLDYTRVYYGLGQFISRGIL